MRSLTVQNDDYIIIKMLILNLIIVLFPIVIASSLVKGLNQNGLYNLLVGGVFLIQILIMVRFFIKYTEKKMSKDLILMLVVLMVSQGLTVFFTNLMVIKLEYFDVINAIAMVVSFFIFMLLPSKTSIDQKGLITFFKSIVILGIVSCTYNMVINFNEMVNFNEIKSAYAVNLSSFYLNRNSFAQFMYFSIIANTFLIVLTNKKRLYVVYLIFFLNLLTTLSRGAIASIIIFAGLYWLLKFKKNILTSLLVTVFTFFSILLSMANSNIKSFISTMLIREEAGSTGRSELWLEGVNLLNQTSWFLGVGEFTSIKYLKSLGYSNSEFHSFYIETLVKGGILLIIFHGLVFFIMSNRYKIILKYNKPIGVLYISAVVSVLFYGFIESISFFTLGYVGTLFTIFFITVPLIYSNNFLEGEE